MKIYRSLLISLFLVLSTSGLTACGTSPTPPPVAPIAPVNPPIANVTSLTTLYGTWKSAVKTSSGMTSYLTLQISQNQITVQENCAYSNGSKDFVQAVAPINISSTSIQFLATEAFTTWTGCKAKISAETQPYTLSGTTLTIIVSDYSGPFIKQ